MTRDESLHILQHALGLDDYGQGNAYRNHYVIGPDCDGWDFCMAHVEAGRMVRRDPGVLTGGMHCFAVTEAGREYVRTQSPKPPKRTRSQRRYDAFLEADSGQSFGEWLKRGRVSP